MAKGTINKKRVRVEEEVKGVTLILTKKEFAAIHFLVGNTSTHHFDAATKKNNIEGASLDHLYDDLAALGLKLGISSALTAGAFTWTEGS
jgi:hypothetical protein